MFTKDPNQTHFWSPKPFEEGKLYIALSGETLLKEASYQRLLERMCTQAGLSRRSFETYYQPLLEQFAQFVQLIPWPEEKGLGGLLARAVEAAFQSLIAIKQQEEPFDEALKIAVFSDALLHFVDTVVLHYRIMIHDHNGYFKKRWDPFFGAMEPGTYYKIRPYAAAIEPTGSIKALLARVILPAEVFQFLSQNLKLLRSWLALLDEDGEGAGQLRYILEPLWARMNNPPHFLNPVKAEAREAPATQEAEHFWQWLKQSIHQGELSVNQQDSLVHRVKEGVFVIYPDVFEEYSRVFSRNINAIVLYRQFNHLGITRFSGYDYKFNQYFSTYPQIGGLNYSAPGAQRPAYNHMVPEQVLDASQNDKNRPFKEQMATARHFLSSLRKNKPPAVGESSEQNPQNELKQGLLITDPGLVFDPETKPELNQHFVPQAKPPNT